MTEQPETYASALARSWRPAWRDFDEIQGDPSLREYALSRARELLSLAVSAHAVVSDDPHVGFAIQVIQELGEGYCLLTEDWPIVGGAAPQLPLRVNLAGTLRQFGLRPWAARLGFPIPTEDIDLAPPESVPTVDYGVLHPRQMTVKHSTMELDWYARIRRWMSTPDGRARVAENRADLRRAICAVISELRGQFALLGFEPDHGGIARRAVWLMLLLNAAGFLAITADDCEALADIPMISEETLEGMLGGLGIREWLDGTGSAPNGV